MMRMVWTEVGTGAAVTLDMRQAIANDRPARLCGDTAAVDFRAGMEGGGISLKFACLTATTTTHTFVALWPV